MFKPNVWCVSFLLLLVPLGAAAGDGSTLTVVTPEGGIVKALRVASASLRPFGWRSRPRQAEQ